VGFVYFVVRLFAVPLTVRAAVTASTVVGLSGMG
jgi:hypothetical protein